MHKFKVTNTSKAPCFLTEAGKLLQPGQSVSVNRLDAGTRDDKRLEIETGDFLPPAPVTKLKPAPTVIDEDDDEPEVKKSAPPDDDTPASLVDSKSAKRTVPLVAPPAAGDATDDESGPDAGLHAEGATDGGVDELEGLIPTADKIVDKTEASGFRTHQGLSDDDKSGR